MKKFYFFLILLLNISSHSFGQIVDSAWMTNYIQRFSSDIGEELPDVNFVDTSGKKITLKELRGKALYINIWSTNCLPCLANYPEQQKLMDDIAKKGSETVLFSSIFAQNILLKKKIGKKL